ncbi:40S ribosomal protein S19 [Candidatus Pacearchaeota archaeon]|nr:40S ribosomal protein S19 [Candidatus Pacearchaeota archaeon]
MVYELDQQEYNIKLAEALKKIPEFKSPAWIELVKSGTGKQRPIEDLDFWYKRSASVLKQIYKRGVVGVSRLRTRYGSKKKRGAKPPIFVRASGKILRTILQQSDKAGFTEIVKYTKGLKKRKPGRVLTKRGKEFMENIK